jgi:hypothetical protein
LGFLRSSYRLIHLSRLFRLCSSGAAGGLPSFARFVDQINHHRKYSPELSLWPKDVHKVSINGRSEG